MEAGRGDRTPDTNAFVDDRPIALSSRLVRKLRSSAWRWLRGHADDAYDQNRFLRELFAVARWPALRSEAPDLAHLVRLGESMGGPLQRDEALLLHGLVRVVRPRTVVEIGFLQGASAFNFLAALDSDARLYSFDIDPACEAVAQRRFGHDARFAFKLRSQTALTPQDIDGRTADFVFLDAAHDLSLNQETFTRLVPLLSAQAILAVHDTGTVPRALLPPRHWAHHKSDGWLADEYEVMSDERAFANWVLETYPEFSQLHLHSTRTIRCGVTLLQRSPPLPRP